MAPGRKEMKGVNPNPTHIKRSILKRVSVLYYIFALFAVMIASMILLIQYGPNGTPLRNRSDLKCFRTIPVPASRGNIFTQDGRIMATDAPFYYITLDWTVPDDSLFQKYLGPLTDSLARLFPEKGRAYFAKRLRDIRNKALRGGAGSQSQLFMRERINQLQLDRIKRFPIFNKGRLGGGFIYTQDPDRYKPFGTLAARTLGSPGSYGLEASFDEVLSGHDGQNTCVRLVKDIWVPVVDKNNIEPVNGQDIVTTIDINLQDIVESELRRQLIDLNATAGTAVVMEVETGAIRAVSNLSRYGETIADDLNHAITLRCEPGSTFKLVSLLAILEDCGMSIDQPVDCTEKGRYYFTLKTGKRERKYLIADSHPVGKTTIQGMMEQSSNIGFVKVIDSLYHDRPERFVNFVRELGYDREINMQLKGGKKPVIKDPSDKGPGGWDGLTLIKMAYGYATELTPIHTLMLYNAIANDGRMIAPMLVSEIREGTRTVKRFEAEVVNPKICSSKTLTAVRQCLEGVVQNGSGVMLRNDRYRIAGKTGTAQMVMPNGRYIGNDGSRDYLATFVGYFPADKPKYSCIVAIKTHYDPKHGGYYYGAQLGVPVFKAIADRIYALDAKWQTPITVEPGDTKEIPHVRGGKIHDIYTATETYDIPSTVKRRNNGWGTILRDSMAVAVAYVDEDSVTMPSVRSMGLKDALFILEQRGLHVVVNGTGEVVSQSIPQGQRIAPGQEVRLTLKNGNVGRSRR